MWRRLVSIVNQIARLWGLSPRVTGRGDRRPATGLQPLARLARSMDSKGGARRRARAAQASAHPRRRAPPPDPPPTPELPGCLCCLMDNQALRMDIWTSLQLDHMPTLRRMVDHRGSALRA